MRRLRIFLKMTGIVFGAISLCAGVALGFVVGMNVLTEHFGPLVAGVFFIAWLSILIGAVVAAAA